MIEYEIINNRLVLIGRIKKGHAHQRFEERYGLTYTKTIKNYIKKNCSYKNRIIHNIYAVKLPCGFIVYPTMEGLKKGNNVRISTFLTRDMVKENIKEASAPLIRKMKLRILEGKKVKWKK